MKLREFILYVIGLALLIPTTPGTVCAQDDRGGGGGGYFPSSLQQPNDSQSQRTTPGGLGRSTPSLPDFTPPPPDPNRVRYAVPDRIFLARAETMMKKIYAPDYADTKPIARRALAIKLLKQATLTSDDPSMKYVLFRESRDLAVQSGYVDVALQAVVQWSASFQIDSAKVEMDTVNQATQAVRAPAAVAALVQACLDQAHRQVDAANYSSADRFEEAAEKASLKTLNGDYIARVHTEVDRLNELEKLAPLALVARDTLKTRPDDPDANTTAGRYLCFAKGQWVEGLPLLARGKDLVLKGLAERDKDATGQSNPTMFALLADDWWQYGESHPGLEQPGSRQRACLWYAKSLPLLSSGLLKQSVQKRLNEQKNDVLALRPEVIHVQGKLSGRHQIDINTAYAQYSHTGVDMPKTISFAGIDWHPAEEPKLMNMGVNLFLSPDVDLTTARVNKIRGKGDVSVKDKSASNATIIIDNPDVTPETFEFDILFD